jgi:hypothetical protein
MSYSIAHQRHTTTSTVRWEWTATHGTIIIISIDNVGSFPRVFCQFGGGKALMGCLVEGRWCPLEAYFQRDEGYKQQQQQQHPVFQFENRIG